MRTLEIMNSNASSDIQGIVTDLLNSRPYSHRQDADSSVAAVITAQSDLRFFSSTFAAVLAQRVLPGTIIVADCTNQVEQPMQMTFSVIPSPAGVLTEVPESKTIRVILVGVKGASSFMNAVARAMQQIDLDDRVGALWTLHDDSRPADESCLEVLLDAWKNTPTASLLGAKQLDWQAESLHNVGLYAGHHNVTSLVVDGEPDQEQYDGRQDVLAVSLSGALVPLATLRTWKGVDPWFGTFAESTDLCRRICLGGGRVVVVPQARIAHRRARFEGVRSKNGQPVEDEEGRVDPYLAEAALGSVTVDEKASTSSLMRMALAFKSASGDQGISGSVYWTDPDYYVDGVGSSVLLDEDKNLELFSELAKGTHRAGTVGTLAEQQS